MKAPAYQSASALWYASRKGSNLTLEVLYEIIRWL